MRLRYFPDLRARLSVHFHTLRRVLSSRSSARSWMWSRVGPPQGCFHTANNTKADRFPAVFREVGDRLGALEACRVLSFGCSTGEEVFSLRKHLPRTEIVGIDINRSSIAQAKRAWSNAGADPRISFHAASSSASEPSQSFDAILAMTVFCSGQLQLVQPESCAKVLSFAAFDAEIARFAERLKPGGLLIVGNANFRVDDTSVANEFMLLKRLGEDAVPGLRRPIYGPDERLLVGVSDRGAIYCRVG